MSFKSREEYEAAIKKQYDKMYDPISKKTTKVKAHPRKGTKGVKSHTRDISSSTSQTVPSDNRHAKQMEYNREVTEEIRRQIGRNTLMRVGAHDYVYGDLEGNPFLQFRVKGANIMRGGKIRVIYNRGYDDYTVELWRIETRQHEKLKSSDGIYAENLGSTIEYYVG